MSKHLLRIGLLAAILANGCAPHSESASTAPKSETIPVSMIQLLASPEHLDGRRIRVQGVFQHGDDERALYLGEDDARYFNLRNSVWLESTNGFQGNGAFVVVEGTFVAGDRGYGGLWPGEICEVSRIERARNREDFAPSKKDLR
jgi:hypothetical protein